MVAVTAAYEKVIARNFEEVVIDILNSLDGSDPEQDHIVAEGLLYDLAPNAVREAYEKAQERAGGWWWA